MQAYSDLVGWRQVASGQGIGFFVALGGFVKVFVAIVYLTEIAVEVSPDFEVEDFGFD